MPIVYSCRRCGRILYVYTKLGQTSYGPPTPSIIASIYGGRCPYCGHPLGRPSLEDITIKPIEERRKEKEKKTGKVET